MKQNSLVSVIIPTLNRSMLLNRAVQSVLSQTYKNFQLLIVDDYSVDDTFEMIKNLNDERIVYIRHGLSKGGSAARNTGILNAKGDFITFLDDDDEWLPAKLEKQVSFFENSGPEVGLIYCGAEKIFSNKKKQIVMPKYKGNVNPAILRGPLVCGINSVMIRKKCFDKAGIFDESFKSCQDWDMWKRIADYYKFDYISESLTKIYFHGTQISSNIESVIIGRERFFSKYNEEIIKYPKIHIEHYKTLGKLYVYKKEWKQAAEYFKEVLKLNFFQIFKIIAWMIIQFPMRKINYEDK